MIRIDNRAPMGRINPFWNNFHFHPTDAIEDDWGRRILDQAASDGVGDMVRMYAMLEDIVTMGEDGALRYDFALNDRRLDYMLGKGFDIFLSYNFIPPCIALDPTAYSTISKNKTRYKGKLIIPSAPKDYGAWEEICYQYTRHLMERYGEDVLAERFLMQCYNEPDIPGFFMKKGTDEDRQECYLRMYRGFSRAIARVSERIRAGGPALAYKQPFMRFFLSHVREEGLKLDFVCFHNYGTNPDGLNSGSRPFDVENTVSNHRERMEPVEEYCPKDLPVIVDEWGASSAGFYNREECPPLLFREDSAYAAYFGKMIARLTEENARVDRMMICLSGQHEMTVDFSGFRNFLTLNFIKKPIYNAYIAMNRLSGARLPASTDAQNLSAMAARADDGRIAVALAYASPHFDRPLPDARETVHIDGVTGAYRAAVWLIDERHTNPYRLAQREGMTDPYTPEQLDRLRAEGLLAPEVRPARRFDGAADIDVAFTNNALAVVELIPSDDAPGGNAR